MIFLCLDRLYIPDGDITEAMADAIGVRPLEAYMARDLLCVLKDEMAVRELTPDLEKIKQLDGLLLHVTYQTFFDESPAWNPDSEKITGKICGVRIEDIEDPTMRRIRCLDKLVDELAKGKSLEKITSRGKAKAASVPPLCGGQHYKSPRICDIIINKNIKRKQK
jgi:hypothetical protein